MAELVVEIEKAYWPKMVMRALTPALRKLGDAHGHLIAAAQPSKGTIMLKGEKEQVEAAKSGLRAIVLEHFPEADMPKELAQDGDAVGGGQEEAAGVEVASGSEQTGSEEAALPRQESAQDLAAQGLRRAYATRSPAALKVALGAAQAAGVEKAHLDEAEAQLRELSAAAALASALRKGASVPELQQALVAAREAGVEDARLEEAEMALSQPASRQAVEDAMQAGREAELREALAWARACGVEAATLETAESQLRTLAAGNELSSAAELLSSLQEAGAVDEEAEAAFAAAVREAASAGVDSSLVAESEAWLDRLSAARAKEAALLQRKAAAPASEDAQPSKRQKTSEASESAPSDSAGGEDGALQREWALRLVESTVLRCRKLKAVEQEDFDLALELKQQEPAVASRLEAARSACQAASQPSGDSRAADKEALELVRRQKQEAVEQEDYDRAAELKEKELELERHGQGGGDGDVCVASAALRLLASSSPEALLSSFDSSLALSAETAGPELWEAVTSELRSAAT
eukprot:TRINITY_DN93454_c0_g1_i1.p1 TRINITY_DN93454_c0_g1~~TRINITY_DN93454_c0_g1_i1.p1  ORF type:complete len:535 (-),score=182.81 TRINITY_DN93454_c0_g1_i1:51-1622(-)